MNSICLTSVGFISCKMLFKITPVIAALVGAPANKSLFVIVVFKRLGFGTWLLAG
jgi:hypothetical protein